MFNEMECFYEIEVSPEKLFDLANKLEFYAKNSHPGQMVRVKVDHQFCLIYRPPVKITPNVRPDIEDLR